MLRRWPLAVIWGWWPTVRWPVPVLRLRRWCLLVSVPVIWRWRRSVPPVKRRLGRWGAVRPINISIYDPVSRDVELTAVEVDIVVVVDSLRSLAQAEDTLDVGYGILVLGSRTSQK